ncbi:MAG: DUF927 domain-containing protein [Actinomycetota bacterium]
MPGPTPPSARSPEVARYALRAAIADNEARSEWAEVVELAIEHPKLLVVLGSSLASLYVPKLDAELFVVHVTGDSRTGKTMLTGAAMAAVGNPSQRSRQSVYRTWNMSAQAPGALLKQMGVMPVWLDETKTNQRDAAETASMVFAIVQGEERLRATQSGGLDERTGWDCVVLSTGEARLSNVGAEQGLRKRVLEVAAAARGRGDRAPRARRRGARVRMAAVVDRGGPAAGDSGDAVQQALPAARRARSGRQHLRRSDRARGGLRGRIRRARSTGGRRGPGGRAPPRCARGRDRDRSRARGRGAQRGREAVPGRGGGGAHSRTSSTRTRTRSTSANAGE